MPLLHCVLCVCKHTKEKRVIQPSKCLPNLEVFMQLMHYYYIDYYYIEYKFLPNAFICAQIYTYLCLAFYMCSK